MPTPSPEEPQPTPAGTGDARSGRIGRPPLTDRASLLAVARRLGFTGLTVGAVTAGAGVRYSTFYRHFPSFEGLQSAMVHAVMSEARFPEPVGPWRSYLQRTSARMVDLLGAHPGLAPVSLGLPERPGRLVELFGQATEVLLAAGFCAGDAVLGAGAAVDLPVAVFADSPGASSGRASRGEQARTTPHPLDPQIRHALVEMVDDPPARWVAARTDLVLDGLQIRQALPR